MWTLSTNELNSKLWHVTAQNITGNYSMNAATNKAVSLTFSNLEIVPTEVRFIYTGSNWCAFSLNSYNINGNSVTVNITLQCVVTSSLCNLQGYLMYR